MLRLQRKGGTLWAKDLRTYSMLSSTRRGLWPALASVLEHILLFHAFTGKCYAPVELLQAPHGRPPCPFPFMSCRRCCSRPR